MVYWQHPRFLLETASLVYEISFRIGILTAQLRRKCGALRSSQDPELPAAHVHGMRASLQIELATSLLSMPIGAESPRLEIPRLDICRPRRRVRKRTLDVSLVDPFIWRIQRLSMTSLVRNYLMASSGQSWHARPSLLPRRWQSSQGRHGCLRRKTGRLVVGFEGYSLLDPDCNAISHANHRAETPRPNSTTTAAWQGVMILVGHGVAVTLHSTTSAPQPRRPGRSIGSSL